MPFFTALACSYLEVGKQILIEIKTEIEIPVFKHATCAFILCRGVVIVDGVALYTMETEILNTYILNTHRELGFHLFRRHSDDLVT